MEIAPEGSDLFVITENGFGKRTPIEEYTEHHRGGQGITTIAMTEKKGQLAGMKIVMPGQELMVVSEEGVVIRVRSNDISQLGRATQGVKVMNMSGSDHVCAVARVAGTKKRPPAQVDAGTDNAGSTEIEGQTALFDDDAEPDDITDVDNVT
jgi:DNA gyrase subunit A